MQPRDKLVLQPRQAVPAAWFSAAHSDPSQMQQLPQPRDSVKEDIARAEVGHYLCVCKKLWSTGFCTSAAGSGAAGSGNMLGISSCCCTSEHQSTPQAVQKTICMCISVGTVCLQPGLHGLCDAESLLGHSE